MMDENRYEIYIQIIIYIYIIYAFSSCKMRTKKLLFAQVRHYTSTQVHLFPNRRKKERIKKKECKEVEKQTKEF